MKLKTMNLILSTLMLLACQSAFSQPWANPKVEKRANDLLKQMTLDEKLAYIGGERVFYIRAINRLGIPEIKMSDGPQGLRNDGKTNALPCGIMLAASWNRDLAFAYGKALGEDAKARGVHILLGPGVNIYRSPMCGRNFEYFGEDPYLTSKTAVNYINGVQREGVMATVKHFAANNQEWNRYTVSSDVDARTLHEIYFPPFEMAVKEAHVGALMSSFNPLNGIHASQNKWLITDILRKQWGFKGIHMSDWTATHNCLEAANNGLDLEMPNAQFMSPDSVKIFMLQGKLNESSIDEKVLRILRTIIGFGFSDNSQLDNSIPLNNPKSTATALAVAREGVVLLKNDDLTLPIKEGKTKRILICGPNTSRFVTGGGSGWMEPFHAVTLLDGIKEMAAKRNIQVEYVDPYATPEKEFFTDSTTKVQGLRVEYLNNRIPKGTVVFERIEPNLHPDWKKLPNISDKIPSKFAVRWSGVIRPIKTAFYNLIITSSGEYKVMVDNKVLMEQDWNLQTARAARIELIAGKTYPICVESFQDNPNPNLQLEWTTVDKELLNNRFAAADLIIANIGFNFSNEMEGFDRTFELPADEAELINIANASGKPVVAVVNAGGNIEMQEWYPKLAGLLWAWYPGQEGGTAIAEVLFGKVNPSGKLPATFEKKWADNPTFNSYYDDNNDKRVTYKEGIFVGYRGYDKNKTEVQFPFGYGLSYTKFELSDLKVEKSANKSSKAIVTCKIKNTGEVEGAEVVQLYIGGKPTDNQEQPIKELKGYEKINLKAGESKNVKFEVSAQDLSYFSVAKNKFVFVAGTYHFMIGTSSRDIKLEQKMAVN